MATAVVALEKLQAGIESVAGTLVAADMVLPAETGGEYLPEIDRQAINEIFGIRGLVNHLDVRKGSMLRYRHVLDFEYILLPLQTGIKTATPNDNDGLYEWVWTPSPTAVEALSSATFEVSYTDGSTRHLQREIGFGTCRSFGINIAANQPAFLTAEYFGRTPQTSTFTASQALLSRQQIPSNLFELYIDSTWAGLGSTKKSTLIRAATLDVTTGAEPDYTLDGRTDLDFTQVRRGIAPSAQLQMTFEYDANGDTEYDAWESNTMRFVRLTAAGSNSRRIAFDLALRYTQPPRFSEVDGLRVMEITGEAVYDPTSGSSMSFEVDNAISAL